VIEVDGVEWGRPDELAPQFAHVTARNVYDWIRDGIIPAGQVRRVGRAMWTTWDAVDRAVDRTSNRGRRRTGGLAPIGSSPQPS
jgi:hypothetical protein